MVLINPIVGEAALPGLINKIEEKIKALGGEVKKTDKWGVKKLQSEFRNVKNLKNAFYVLFYFDALPSVPLPLKAYLKVTEHLVRFSVMLAVPKDEREIEGKPIVSDEVAAVAVPEIKVEADGGQS